MNGRIYDPGIGRFLQADPFVQFPNDTQSYNRYSYVLNNPLRYTDPSGYFLKELANFAYNVVQMVVTQQWTNPAAWADLLRSGYELMNALQGGGGNLISGVASGAFGNGAANGNISYFGPPQSPGCAYSPMNCGGTSSSGAGRYDHVIVESILGGTYSEMTGGKFANGAFDKAMLIMLWGQPRADQRASGTRGQMRHGQVSADDYAPGFGDFIELMGYNFGKGMDNASKGFGVVADFAVLLSFICPVCVPVTGPVAVGAGAVSMGTGGLADITNDNEGRFKKSFSEWLAVNLLEYGLRKTRMPKIIRDQVHTGVQSTYNGVDNMIDYGPSRSHEE